MDIVNVQIIDKFIDEHRCVELINLTSNGEHVQSGFVEVKRPAEISDVVWRIKEQVKLITQKDLIVKHYYVRKYDEESEVSEHSDDSSGLDNQSNGTIYSALLYLNNDFVGGELVFTKLRIVVHPEPGRLVLFPSNREYAHKTTSLVKAGKCVLAVFMTNSSHGD